MDQIYEISYQSCNHVKGLPPANGALKGQRSSFTATRFISTFQAPHQDAFLIRAARSQNLPVNRTESCWKMGGFQCLNECCVLRIPQFDQV